MDSQTNIHMKTVFSIRKLIFQGETSTYDSKFQPTTIHQDVWQVEPKQTMLVGEKPHATR